MRRKKLGGPRPVHTNPLITYGGTGLIDVEDIAGKEARIAVDRLAVPFRGRVGLCQRERRDKFHGSWNMFRAYIVASYRQLAGQQRALGRIRGAVGVTRHTLSVGSYPAVL